MRHLLTSIFLVTTFHLYAAEPAKVEPKKPEAPAVTLPDLTGYRTAATAITTQISMASPLSAAQPGYLGIHVTVDPKGQLVLAEVGEESPAGKAGLRSSDQLVQLDGKDVKTPEVVRKLLQKKAPGETVKIKVARQNQPMEVTAVLAAVSKPMKLPQRAVLGVQVENRKEGGVVIQEVLPDLPAAKASLKAGEIILKVEGTAITNVDKFRDLLGAKKPGDTVTLTLLLAEKAVDFKVQLAAEQITRGGGGWDSRLGGYWSKNVYRLAVIHIGYPDVKVNAKITPKSWEDSLFSRGAYKTSATGEAAHGSLADYYHEQSYGALKVEGKVFAAVEVSKKRTEYGQDNTRQSLLTEAIDKVLARDGKEALKDFDGLAFIYAGGRVQTQRGGLYWPHRATLSHQGKRWAYFICEEGGDKMANISVFCHEFGHMLGLPDLYSQSPNTEGLSVWCAMSQQAGAGRPQHFCAWAKEKLGWIKPAVIDPVTKQKLILGPVEDSGKECYKVLVRPDGSEYFLLENRTKKGFDQSLPGEGLLIWRVVGNRPILEESHGVEGPAGPRVFMDSVPYPSAANQAFTPRTTPSSGSQLAGGQAVHITNIRKLPDGRVTFHIGYEYQ